MKAILLNRFSLTVNHCDCNLDTKFTIGVVKRELEDIKDFLCLNEFE